jgi:hypothetical protein
MDSPEYRFVFARGNYRIIPNALQRISAAQHDAD